MKAVAAEGDRQRERAGIFDAFALHRQTVLAGVPTFALVIAALVLGGGIAYAAYRLITDVVLPAMGQDQDEETAASDEVDGDAVLAAYQEVIDEYLAALEAGDVEDDVIDESEGAVTMAVTELWSAQAGYTSYPHISHMVYKEYCRASGSYDYESGHYVIDGAFYYCLMDINLDGVDELLIGCQSAEDYAADGAAGTMQIYAGYGYADGEVVGLFCVDSYEEYLLLNDGVLARRYWHEEAQGQYMIYTVGTGTVSLSEALTWGPSSLDGVEVGVVTYTTYADGETSETVLGEDALYLDDQSLVEEQMAAMDEAHGGVREVTGWTLLWSAS